MSLKGLVRQILSLGPASRARYRLAEGLLRRADVPSDEVRRRLPELLACDNWEVRNLALKLIAKIRDEDRFHVLPEKLLDGDEAGIVRRNAAELLADWGKHTPQVEAALCAALDDGYWEVRSQAARALAVLALPGGLPEDRLLQRLYGSNGNGNGNGSAGHRRPLRERHFEVRACLAEALGALGESERAFTALQDLADDGEWLVRFQAAVALAEFAARRPEYHDRALECVRLVDHLSCGALPLFVFPRRMGKLIDELRRGPGVLDPAVLRRRYIRLKQGWHRADEAQW